MHTTLYKIAKEVSLMRFDKSEVHIPNYILIGKEILGELNVLGFMPIKSVMLDIDKNTNSAKLPNDYLKWVRVGLCVCDRIIELDYDSTICTREVTDNFCDVKKIDAKGLETDCNCIINGGVPQGYNSYYYWNNIRYNNNDLEPIYTMPAYTSKGFFKIEKGRIFINSVCAPYKLVLQYKSDLDMNCGGIEIPNKLKDVVKYGIQWRVSFFDKSIPIGLINLYKSEYTRKKDLLTMQDVMTSILDMLKSEMSSINVANLGR